MGPEAARGEVPFAPPRTLYTLCASGDPSYPELLREAVRTDPGMPLAQYMKTASIYLQPVPLAIVAEGLRKAGLPEE